MRMAQASWRKSDRAHGHGILHLLLHATKQIWHRHNTMGYSVWAENDDQRFKDHIKRALQHLCSARQADFAAKQLQDPVLRSPDPEKGIPA